MVKTKKKGFTIVELVIVIAVIGILSAVLIPTFSNLVSKANTTAEQEGLRNAYTKYAAEYDEADGTLYAEEDVVFYTLDDDDDVDVAYKLDTTTGKWVKLTSVEIATIKATATPDADSGTDTTEYVKLGTETFNTYYLAYKHTYKAA